MFSELSFLAWLQQADDFTSQAIESIIVVNKPIDGSSKGEKGRKKVPYKDLA